LQSKFGQRFLYGNGPAQVGFGLLTRASPFKKRTERNTPATHTVGKREAIGHPLPVVAIGLIPYIYRRASFSHRAAPKEIAPYGEQHYRSLTARQRSLQLSNPRREICFFFKRQLSFLEIRLYFMHLIRLRIHASNFVNWVVTVANTGLK